MSLQSGVVEYVKTQMAGNDGSHDWFHIERVCNMAKYLAVAEGFNSDELEIVDLSALLHDLKDWKYSKDNITGGEASCQLLAGLGAEAGLIASVSYIVDNIGYSKGLVEKKSNIEVSQRLQHCLKVVQDADQLDAMGAIGIARCFGYGGTRNRALYDPSITPRETMTLDEYKYGPTTSINHFYEKLLKLRDRIQTSAGKLIAEKRHQIMVNYVREFELETN
jgi:uncharacterized protein